MRNYFVLLNLLHNTVVLKREAKKFDKNGSENGLRGNFLWFLTDSSFEIHFDQNGLCSFLRNSLIVINIFYKISFFHSEKNVFSFFFGQFWTKKVLASFLGQCILFEKMIHQKRNFENINELFSQKLCVVRENLSDPFLFRISQKMRTFFLWRNEIL